LANRLGEMQMLSRGRIVLVIACALALTGVLGCTPGPSPQLSPTTPPDRTLRPALQFSPTTLPDAQVGAPYAATITVSRTVTPVGGGSITDGALPAGLKFEVVKETANTVRISGTPTVAGTFSFTIYVWCFGTNVSGQTSTQQYVLVVK
jgi:large repetitive protein